MTVRVETVGRYGGDGTSGTDANGSVALPLSNETRTVTVTVVGRSRDAATTATLASATGERMSFGMQVSPSVGGVLVENRTGGIDREVSTWIRGSGSGATTAGHATGGGPPERAENEVSENGSEE